MAEMHNFKREVANLCKNATMCKESIREREIIL